MAIGRISGQLLKDDLQRDGKNLAFDTNLLFLDVVNRRIGINNTTPSNDLQVTGTARATNLLVNNTADIAQIHVETNTISTANSILNLVPNAANAVVVQAKLQVDNLELTSNNVNALGTNKDINIRPTGTGKVNVYSDVLVNGNLHATGTITADGNVTLGDSNLDSISFLADIVSDIRPDIPDTYSLGTFDHRWLNTYTKNLNTTTVNAGTIVANGINLGLAQGKTWYVAVNGLDTKSGVHQNDPFLTITKALSVAQSGDTIYIYPGTYVEVFPLTMPVGITIRGAGVRSVMIQPTSGTRSQDAFLLNGETTIEDVSIGMFEYNAGSNTGYAFKLANNFRVTSRSPYIRNVSVITQGSTVRLGTNPADDPRGFLAGDAGRGALFDGAVASALSKDVSVLFHSCTFIIPGADGIRATNGVRLEWLNSFIYFANRGFYLTTGISGQAGVGTTGLKIAASNRVGTWNVGNTVTYYDTDGTTVLGTGSIASVSGDWVYLTGNRSGFQTITDRPGKPAFVNGGAKLSTARAKFGTASLVVNNTNPSNATDYIQYSSSADYLFGTSPYTIEMQVYATQALATNQILADFRISGTAVVPTLYINATTNTIRYVVNGNVILESSGAIPLNTWTHVAVSKVGTSLKLFINGIQSGATYTDNLDYVQGQLRIGARYDATNGFIGYIDEVRVVNGVGKFSSNFTAPTAQYKGDADTVLLLHLDGSNNSTLILDDGASIQDLRTNAGGTATKILYADYTKFGSEIRSIGSANVYGTYGIVGDGPGVIAYVIGHNFAYIGSGRFSDNDPTRVIDGNEVVKTNLAKIYYNYVDNEGNFNVGDYFSVDQKTGAVTFNGSSFNIPSTTQIVLTDGVNTTTIDATKVETGNINISGNTISSLTGDLIISPSTGSIIFNSSQSLGLPKGTTLQRPSPADSGMVRFNTTENWFEGYNGSNWIPLGLVTDIARTTYIKAEATPGAGDKTLYFYANNTQAATLTDTAFTVNKVDVGNFEITNNTITPVTANTDINIQPTGTGGLIVGNIKLSTNTITNLTAGAVTTIQPSGTGYVRIPGTNGVVIPAGDSNSRPGYAVLGMIRYNTQIGQSEIFDGNNWVSVTGSTGSINVSTANDIGLLQALIFG